ncbi:MAG: enoyl-CoA hydratase/isomerase family protein [Oscillochloris sp.]|nr:enoyl-CoA hydratase/isomerase family protein [Oscillochloris sp.]
MGEFIVTAMDGPVATITLNRPDRHNSLIPELLEELLATLEVLSGRADLRAVVLQANGRSFSTGIDMRSFATSSDRAVYADTIVNLLNRVMLAMIDLPVPLITAVHGLVTGGSLGLVLTSDIVLLAPGASFTPYYTTVGLSPDGGWTALLPALVGHVRAAEILLLERTISAEEAVAWGLANRIVSAASIREEALAMAHTLAGQLPGSVRQIRRLLWANADGIAQRLETERNAFVAQIDKAEAERGIAAFLNRRRNG